MFEYEQKLAEYKSALERAKGDTVLVTDPYIYQKAMHIYFPHCIDHSKTPQDNFAMYATQGQVYTINMEEKIEVVCQYHSSRKYYHDAEWVDCTKEQYNSLNGIGEVRIIARIAAPKNESDHECTMDLMTDVCVYSCECGKIEVASNLSYHDKPKRYIPESAPKKEEESEARKGELKVQKYILDNALEALRMAANVLDSRKRETAIDRQIEYSERLLKWVLSGQQGNAPGWIK